MLTIPLTTILPTSAGHLCQLLERADGDAAEVQTAMDLMSSDLDQLASIQSLAVCNAVVTIRNAMRMLRAITTSYRIDPGAMPLHDERTMLLRRYLIHTTAKLRILLACPVPSAPL